MWSVCGQYVVGHDAGNILYFKQSSFQAHLIDLALPYPIGLPCPFGQANYLVVGVLDQFKYVWIQYIILTSGMLTRSKVKLEESVRHVQQDLPYFSQEQQPFATHMYKPSKNPHLSNVSSNQQVYQADYFLPNQAESKLRTANYSRNQILKELRQEYEILKNLPLDDNLNIHPKKHERHDGSRVSESSSVSSSFHSKKSSKVKPSQKQFGSPRVNSKELEAMHLQKKQLEIVIGNSMRKIQELLNNEILLKKTIHELKNQIEGKGGVHQEYEKTIKGMQKTIDELQEELNKSSHENEKIVQKMKELSEKIRFLQGQLGSKERQIKQGFDEQKRLHELIRIEKDKFLNLQIQCKTYKMEFELLEKEKSNEMNRLIRQFESKQGGNEKQMAYIIKRLEEDIKQKDKKYHDLLVEKQQLRREKERVAEVVEKRSEKNYLQEMMEKSRELNEYNNKALADSMNLIIVKMAEIEKKSDATLKKEIESLKRKTDDTKRVVGESELMVRVAELEKMVQREISEKSRLADELRVIKQHRYELEDKNKALDKKIKQLSQRQEQLKQQIATLQQFKTKYNPVYAENQRLQQEITSYTLKIQSLQSEVDSQRELVDKYSLSHKQKEKRYEEEIRVLRRKADEAQFEIEKNQKQADFNISMLRAQHEAQIKRLTEQKNRASFKIKETQQTLSGSQSQWQAKLKAKEIQIADLKSSIQSLKLMSQDDLSKQKQFYSQKMIAIQLKYNQEIKVLSDKFAALTSANERLIAQAATYGRMQSELVELRRALKQSRSMNTTINHLWDIKQVEYGNINDILASLKSNP